MSTTTPKLFQPCRVGGMSLMHRVVMCPLTRYKATRLTHVPSNGLMKTYYAQRSSTPGTLIITEATFIAAKAGGYYNVPGIWSSEQVTAWKEITGVVHTNQSFIFCQLWALGRSAEVEVLKEENPSFPYIAPSPIPLSSRVHVPRELTITEVKEYAELYTRAARNAIEAGFDGVEIHGANGYLPDQFIKEISNERTDQYGGSIENRSRFILEITLAVSDAVGAERVGLRISPWGIWQDMRLDDPIPQYTHLVLALKERIPNLGYLHVVEPIASGPEFADKSNDFLRKIWKPGAFISAGGYERDSAIRTAEEKGDLVAFGRQFISNPDLPIRLRENIPLNKPNPKTFYIRGDRPDADVGYIDYPFANSMQEALGRSTQNRL